MGRPTIEHDNARVRRFLSNYFCVSELCEGYPKFDDIFSGALSLKTTGKSSTRTLSRSTLFHMLQHCRVVSTKNIHTATNRRYAYSTLAEYAACARVVSKAIESYVAALPPRPEDTTAQSRRELDAPYMAQLAAAGLA